MLRLIAIAAVIAAATVAASLFVTNPTKIGPLGVTAWFVVVLIAITGGLTVGLYWFKSRFPRYDTERARLIGSLRQGLLVGLGVSIGLALASLRQFSLRDGVMIAILLVLIEFYFRTRS